MAKLNKQTGSDPFERTDTTEELSVLINTLIENRRREHDRRRRNLARDLLLEEIACFKDTIALHRRLMENHDPPRD